MAYRFDAAEKFTPGKAVKMANGFVKAPARIGRVGVFPYRYPDGKVLMELRPPEEVFHADSIASYSLAPITEDHRGFLIGSENYAANTIGTVGENITHDDQFVEATTVFQEKSAIKRLEAGKVQLSPGYTLRLDMTPGIWNGVRYDAVQRDIRCNHLSLVSEGKQSGLQVRLDSADAVVVTSDFELVPMAQNLKGANMEPKIVTVRFDGVDFQIPESAAQAAAKDQAKAEKLQAHFDAADSENKDLKAKLAEATDPAKFQAAVATRVTLETKARDVLGTEVRLDSMDQLAIHIAVLKKLSPKMDLTGKSATYIEARFDAALEAKDSKPAPKTARFDSADGVVTAPVTKEERLAKQRADFEAYRINQQKLCVTAQ